MQSKNLKTQDLRTERIRFILLVIGFIALSMLSQYQENNLQNQSANQNNETNMSTTLIKTAQSR